MNITLVGTFPPYRGGIAHFNTTLFQKLSVQHSMYAVNFITQYPNFLFPGKTQYEDNDYPKLEPCDRLLSSINPLTWLNTASAIASKNPDVIIIKYWMPFFAPVFGRIVRKIKKKISTKVLVICDNIIPHERHFFDTFLTRYFFDVVDYSIVMSKSVERDLLLLYPMAKYRYVPHPIYNIFGKGMDKTKARKRLGLTTERIILYFGLIRPYKGLDILIKAAKELKTCLSDFTILVVGECYEDPEKYKNLVTQNKVEEVLDLRMEFVQNDDVAIYFSAADVVALPYKTATQSGIVPIAYHFNRPVIVSDVGGLPEIVSDGEVGYVVSPNSKAFASAIKRFFIENHQHEFSNNVAKYKKLFSWDRMIETIEELVAG